MSTIGQIAGNGYHDPLASFTDREEILALFQQALRSAQRGRLHLLAVKANSGTGKTFLIDYLTREICPSANWQWGQLRFALSIPDFGSILEGIESALKGCVSRENLKQYRTRRDDCNRRFDEYKGISIGSIQQTLEATVLSSISDSPQSVQINAQLRERELHLRSEWSRALIELAEECEHPLCLFIDGYEQLTKAAPELTGWLWEQVLLKLVKAAPQPLVIMTCGWEWPSNPVLERFTKVKLTDFDLEQVKSYLEKQGVIASTTDPSASENQELIAAFYDLTKGHPLVLGLAVTYFQELDSHERTTENIKNSTQLINEQARIEFLDDRLLSRLEEPYRTLLERGPILRSFDEAALKALLQTEATIATLDDRAYIRFLQYPFINQKSGLGSDPLGIHLSFHSLVRRVRLQELCHHHPQTKEQMHRKMTEYYRKLVETERKLEADRTASSLNSKGNSPDDCTEWLAGVPAKELKVLLEWFYHGLQVKELQADTFETWKELTWRVISRWQHQQARLFLEVVEQLIEEGEPFLSETSDPFNQYLLIYSRFLMQEAYWDEARGFLEKAADYFERVANISDLASCFGNIGCIYDQQGKLILALNYHESALTFKKKIGDPANIALSLNNIGAIYMRQGKLALALNYYEQALFHEKQVDNHIGVAYILNNIGAARLALQEWEKALSYFEEALKIFEQKQDLIGTAITINNIGKIYQKQEKPKQALNYYRQSLILREKIDNPAATAITLNNIGDIYYLLSKPEQALGYYERSLTLREQIDNPAEIAISLNNIGNTYRFQEKFEEALKYHEQALALKKLVGDPIETAISHNNIGSIYLRLRKSEQAIKHFTEAVRIYQHLGRGFESMFANEIKMLAACYLQLGKFEKAVEYNTRAKRIYESIHKTS